MERTDFDERAAAGRTCNTCRHCGIMQAPGTKELQKVCRRYPPTIIGIPMPNGQGGMGWAVNTLYPMLKGDEVCGEFSPKLQ